jgi:hypothetical protein
MSKMLSENQKWYLVSLRLIGERLPVDRLEAILNIEPSYIGKLGEHIQGNQNYAKHHTNIWTWDSPLDDNVPFETQLDKLLLELEPRKKELFEILSIQGVKGELFLGFGSENGQGGANFSNEIIKRIAMLGLDIGLDLYPPDIDEK